MPNFIVRSDIWRSRIYDILNSSVKTNFLKVICANYATSFQDLETKDFYKFMVENPADEIINRALLFFTGHLLRRIEHYEIVILQSPDNKPWFTSDNPVILKNRTSKLEIMTKDSEIYFPINTKYLAYIHFKDANDKKNELRKSQSNTITLTTDWQHDEIQKLIISNIDEYLIFSGELQHRINE